MRESDFDLDADIALERFFRPAWQQLKSMITGKVDMYNGSPRVMRDE